MSEIVDSLLIQKPKYTARVVKLPDLRAVQSITLWSKELSIEELCEVVEELYRKYHPMKMILLDD